MDIVNIREDVNTFIVVLRFLAMPIDRPVDHNWFTTLSYVATSAPLKLHAYWIRNGGGECSDLDWLGMCGSQPISISRGNFSKIGTYSKRFCHKANQ